MEFMPCTHRRPGRPRAQRSDRLGPGRSAAPGDQRLSLLPSGPDEVHTSPLRGTRSSTSISPSASANAGLGWEFSPAGADCRYRAPLVPRLARRADSTGGVLETSRTCFRRPAVAQRRPSCRERREHERLRGVRTTAQPSSGGLGPDSCAERTYRPPGCRSVFGRCARRAGRPLKRVFGSFRGKNGTLHGRDVR
jgi:hypothetical protein